MGRRRPVDPDTQYFRYLNRLRAGGRTNMYGAVPYLMRTFGLERGRAFDVVCRWVDSYEALVEQGAEGQIVVRPPVPGSPTAPAATKSVQPVVVHRPRRATRAKPPKNRKPVPQVKIRISKAAASTKRERTPKPTRKPARR